MLIGSHLQLQSFIILKIRRKNETNLSVFRLFIAFLIGLTHVICMYPMCILDIPDCFFPLSLVQIRQGGIGSNLLILLMVGLNHFANTISLSARLLEGDHDG